MPKDRSRFVKERNVGKRLFIFCEGENTEPRYIERYKVLVRQSGFIERIVVIDTGKNTPVQLVEEASELSICSETAKPIDVAVIKKFKLENIGTIKEDDQFWVVFDRENVNKYGKSLMAKAFQKAKNNNINIAISNVCFELWLLLHLENKIAAPYTSCANLLANSNFKKILKQLDLPTDNMKSLANADKIMRRLITQDLVKQARTLAKQMNKSTENASNKDCPIHELNPYTNFYKLLDTIDDFIKKD